MGIPHTAGPVVELHEANVPFHQPAGQQTDTTELGRLRLVHAVLPDQPVRQVVDRPEGKVVAQPLPEPDPLDLPAGRVAIVTDPQGAVLGLARLTDEELAADSSTPRAGTFFWMEYLAQDHGAAVDFYTDTLGYTPQPTGSDARPYTVLSRGRARGGVLQAPDEVERPLWLPSILVDDPAALAERARSLGGTVLLEPDPEIRNGSLAIVADPSGAVVALQKFPY